MPEVVIMGEMLAEIMRESENVGLNQVGGVFRGPYPSGAPAICCDVIARLGHETAMISGVGKDDFGNVLLERLKKDGVDTSHVLVNDCASTGCAFVTYFSDGSRKFIFHMGNTPAVEAKAPGKDEFSDAKLMHIMGGSLAANQDFAREILKTMHQMIAHGTKISFDPNIREELFRDENARACFQQVIENANIFLPGREELLLLTGEKNVEAAIQKCFRNRRMDIVAIKNGAKGSCIYTREGKTEVGAYKVVQQDATGAGDCFDGAFLAGFLEGRTLKEAAQMGAAAGALNAAAFGPMEGKISQETVWKLINEGKYEVKNDKSGIAGI